jgi:hypothetical protein
MSTEHDFTGTREEWEERVILNAVTFRVHRYIDGGGHDSMEIKDYEEALKLVGREMGSGKRLLLYAITESGRYVVVPQNKYRYYYELRMRRN